jgi:hypothetical protein
MAGLSNLRARAHLVMVAAGPLFVAAVVRSFIRRLAKLEFDIDELLRQVNAVLDSTAVFTGRAPGSLPGQSPHRGARALVAEADGNRTRQRRGTPLTGFEDQGNHQESRRLRGRLY